MSAHPVDGATATAVLADLLTGPERPAEVLGAFPTAVYLRPLGTWRVLAVEARDGVGLPNGVRLGALSAGLRLADVRHATVGEGRVVLAEHRVEIDRWRDPRLRLDGPEARRVLREADRLGVVAADEPELSDAADAVAAAISAGDVGGAAEAAGRLIGAGAGLTPSGDDVLAGLLSGLRTLAPPLRLDGVDRAAHDAGGAVVAAALERTTALSTTLLWHAARAELADPARHALRGLAGRTPFRPARDALAAVGHRSGRDLALGLLVAAHVLASGPRIRRPARSA